jgi:hypothetical protein
LRPGPLTDHRLGAGPDALAHGSTTRDLKQLVTRPARGTNVSDLQRRVLPQRFLPSAAPRQHQRGPATSRYRAGGVALAVS